MKFDFPCGTHAALMVADGVIDLDICEKVISECRRYYEQLFEPGPTLGGVDVRVKASMDFNFGTQNVIGRGVDPALLTHCEQQLTESLWTAFARYQETFHHLMYWPQISDTGFRLQHSPKSRGYYRPHCDGLPWDAVEDPTSNRVCGVICYLNDVMTGGGTHFPEHDYTVDARAGRIAIFPTYWTHPHAGMVPLDGEKWIVSTFLTCKRREPSKMSAENNSLEIAEVDDSESQEEQEETE